MIVTTDYSTRQNTRAIVLAKFNDKTIMYITQSHMMATHQQKAKNGNTGGISRSNINKVLVITITVRPSATDQSHWNVHVR